MPGQVSFPGCGNAGKLNEPQDNRQELIRRIKVAAAALVRPVSPPARAKKSLRPKKKCRTLPPCEIHSHY